MTECKVNGTSKVLASRRAFSESELTSTLCNIFLDSTLSLETREHNSRRCHEAITQEYQDKEEAESADTHSSHGSASRRVMRSSEKWGRLGRELKSALIRTSVPCEYSRSAPRDERSELRSSHGCIWFRRCLNVIELIFSWQKNC